MALKTFRPTTPSTRQLVLVDRSHLHKGRPLKALTEAQHSSGGRNSDGRVTSRWRGGGHKKLYRVIDFKRRKFDVEGTVERLEYDPNRSAFIALVKYTDGELNYILAPQRLAAGDAAGTLAVAALGTVLYLWQFPHFMAIAWLYRGQYAAAGMRMLTVDDPSGLRAAGQALAASLAMVPVSLVLAVPSGSIRLFLAAATASLVYAVATVGFAVRRDDASARTLLFTSLGSLLALLTASVVFGPPV